eukprot:6025079-Pyramimonas_sp.AAC.1
MGIGISLPFSSCNEPLLCCSHMALICVPTILGLSLGKIPKTSTVPDWEYHWDFIGSNVCKGFWGGCGIDNGLPGTEPVYVLYERPYTIMMTHPRWSTTSGLGIRVESNSF